jgi:hypothetical protein
LWGLEDKITCPYFNIGGQGEGQLAVDGQKFYDKLTCPKAQHIIATKEGGEAHCGVNNESLEHQIMFDWLEDVFNKSRSIYDAGWSSLVARRAHNAPNNRLCRIQTT